MKKNSFFKDIGAFLKKNVYYVILFVCVAGIATMITFAAIGPGTAPVGGGDQVENPGPIDDGPIDELPIDAEPIRFSYPMANFELGMGYSVGQDFLYSVTLKDWRNHHGMDFLAETGTNVLAVYEGVVESVKISVLNGSQITIRHSGDLTTVYKSVAALSTLRTGDRVRAGDVIGTVTDDMLSECLETPHIHLEVLYKGAYTNPLDYFEPGEK
jgi:murein DD-endopeptidase MepM/ murein hydrolase activator NlpD